MGKPQNLSPFPRSFFPLRKKKGRTRRPFQMLRVAGKWGLSPIILLLKINLPPFLEIRVRSLIRDKSLGGTSREFHQL